MNCVPCPWWTIIRKTKAKNTIRKRKSNKVNLFTVPVYNENALQIVLFDGETSHYGRVVKITISVWFVVHRVVTRWSNYSKSIVDFVVHQIVEQLNGAPKRQSRCRIAVLVKEHAVILGRNVLELVVAHILAVFH